MRVRFTEFCAGPTGGYAVGSVHDLEDALAARYIELGRAVEATDAPKPKRERATRTARETRTTI